ncbi:MAG: phage baseplate assembly protein V [Acidimicrobiales bacterium]
MSPIALTAPVVEAKGKPLPEALKNDLIEVRVEQALNQPARCVLRFKATDHDQGGVFGKPGNAVKVGMPRHGRLFEGELVAIEVERTLEGTPTLTVVAYDVSIRMAAITNVRTFLDQTASNIVSKLTYPMTAVVDGKAPYTSKIPYLLQAGTDLELLDLLAARTGGDWWCDGEELHLKTLDSKGTRTIKVKAKELEQLSVRASAHRPDKIEVRGWDSTQQQPIVGTSTLGDATMSANGKLVMAVSRASWFNRQHITSALPTATGDEAKVLAEALMRRSASAAVHAEGEGIGLTELRPGMSLEVADSGSLEGTYLVTEVQHHFAPGLPPTTRFVAGDRHPGAGTALFGDAGHHSIDSYTGVVVGKVTNIKDKEKKGRVKVRFMGLSSEHESAWARVVVPGAGKGRGDVKLPEVNDEVLVGFEGGDLRKPVVIGGLFNNVSTIPEWQVDDQGKVAGRRMTSRLGHYIEIADQLDSQKLEHILLSLKDNKTQLRLAKDKAHLLVPAGNPLTIEVGSQSKVVFDGNGKITIDCVDLEIKAKNKIVMDAVQIEGKAKATVKLTGNATAEIAGNASAKIQGGGMLELKGGIVKIN